MSRYDSAITIFSPSGNLKQVEYAMEAVKMGQLTVAVKCKDGVVFAVEKKTFKKLQDSSSIKKIHQIDHHVMAAFSGLNSDGRILVNRARIEAQSYKLNYDVDPSVDYMSRYVSKYVQKYTQKGGARPFGLSMFVAGMNEDGNPALFLIEPSGMITSWKAHAVGKNSQNIIDYFTKNFEGDKELSVLEGVRLAARPLCENVDNARQNIEVCVITKAGTKFLNDEQMETLVTTIEKDIADEQEDK